MASRYDRITKLYQYAQEQVASPEGWRDFLRTACRNYRLTFPDQLLVYIQRPDATALLEIERWNRRFHRWVNKGATGIAVFDSTHIGRVKYYFDISDTHPGRKPRPVPIWQMQPEHEAAVQEALEKKFGSLEDKSTFSSALVSAVYNAVAANLEDYLGQLLYYKAGSHLEPLDDDGIRIIYRTMLQSSISYMLLSRCGLDPEAQIPTDSFDFIQGFNTPDTLNALGVATGIIGQMCLDEIARTVLTFEQNRTVASVPKTGYSGNRTQQERSQTHGRNELQNGERVSASRPAAAPGTGSTPWEIRIAAPAVPEAAQTGDVHESADHRELEPAPVGDPADGHDPAGSVDVADGSTAGVDGGAEGQGSASLGGHDEQHPAGSRGERSDGAGVQLTTKNAGGDVLPAFSDSQLTIFDIPSQENTEQLSIQSHFQLPQQLIDEALCIGSNREKSRIIICAEFRKDKPLEENAAFLQKHYGTNGAGFFFDGRKVSIWYTSDGIRISWGSTAQIRHATVLTWEQAAKRIRELLDLGRYMPHNEIDQAVDYDRKVLADHLVYFRRELSKQAVEAGFLPLTSKFHLSHDWYPETKSELHLALENPEQVELFIKEFEELAAAWEKDSTLIKSKQYDPRETMRRLSDLRLEPVRFEAAEYVSHDRQYFISDDERDQVLRTRFSDYRLNVYSYFATHKELSDRERFLKSLHSAGSGSYGGNDNLTYDSKGILFSHGNVSRPYAKLELGWSAAAKRIGELIQQNLFLDDKDRAAMSDYEHKQLATEIRTFFANAPDLFQRPYSVQTTPEFWDGVQEIQKQLTDAQRVEQIYTEMMLPLWESTPQDDRSYESRKQTMEHMRSFREGTYSVFGTGKTIHPAVMPETPHPEKETPVENSSLANRPVGRIEFLGSNGKVRESIEYSDPEQFVKTILNENDSGVPMCIVLYRDQAGNTIPKDFLQQLDPPPQGFSIVDAPYLEQTDPNTEPVQEEQHAIEQPIAVPKPRRERVEFTSIHPEIPTEQRSRHRITDTQLGHGTKSEKYAANVAAIRLLKQIEAEDRLATPAEQEVLSRYVGWGGLADCFDDRHPKYLELKNLLTEEEYEAARESTLTAFYTSPIIIQSIYQALAQMGFEAGNILEPACGVGNFIGMLPDSMAASKVYGVELDSVSGRIAQQLYQNSSIAVTGFEKVQMPDSFFDVAIGNVPFGDFKVNDKRYDKHHWLIHDYFFGKTHDKVRPGGIVAFITSKGTMDKENSAVRRYLAQRADLIGAIRLPNTAFKQNAGTEVTSDILFLQKRDRMTDIEPEWVQLDTDENGIRMNRYFVQHPEMILGQMVMESGRFGMESICKPREGDDLAELLSEAVQYLHAQIIAYDREEPEEDRTIPADPSVRNFSYCIVDGKLYFRENSRMHPVDASVTAANRIRGMVALRDCVRKLIELQTENYPDEDIVKEQQRLNSLYDSYTEKYGRLTSRGNSMAFGDDSSYSLLCSLEVLDEERNFKRKADMFTKRTIRSHTPVTTVDTASEALAVAIAEKARVDMAYMSELSGKSEAKLEDELSGVIFRDIQCAEEVPQIAEADLDLNRYPFVTADEYLSGNVRRKLRMAKALVEALPPEKRYAVHGNVTALEAVQPVDLTAGEIGVRIGANWVPIEIYRHFMFELFGTSYMARRKMRILHAKGTGEWNITNKNADANNIRISTTFGTKRINAYHILEQTLNQKDVRVYDKQIDEYGNEVRVLNKRETAVAQDRQELIKAKFSEWIWQTIDRREMLCRLYNETFNAIRPREYDGRHIRFVGMNPEITLRKHQINAIAHIMYGGNTLLAHEVGAGKTYEIVAAAMESKRLGLCTKSLIVVPNHLTEQWAAEWLQLYPSANILVATKRDFETQNRKRFCGRIATGDYDAVIIGHSQFEKIPMSRERQEVIFRRQIDSIMDSIAEAKSAKAERYTIKQMERTRKSLAARLEKLNDQSRKDDVVTFEELGVDRVFVDESHYFKNLFLATKMRNVSGIAQTEAQKSSDLFMKCQYLDEITGGRGVVFATGTPISNSMVELYTIQRYLQYHTLEEMDMLNFDDWAANFGETITAIELSPEGSGYRAKTRFAKFYNLPELMATFRQVADIQTADMLKLPVPKANFHTEVIKPSELQQEMVKSLADRAEAIRGGGIDPSVDNMLRITNDGRKLALDIRLINPLAPDDENGKVATCARNVYRIWKETEANRSTQMVFCDLSTPTNTIDMVMQGETAVMAPFQNVYDDLTRKLIALGIPATQIAYIHDANSEAKKKELFAKVRAGQIRVLLGSTQKMGAGTNCQDRLIALHDLDCPWRPSDLAQRLGRIVRQGNQNPEVEIFRYVTENTFDAYLYQLVENKQKFIAQVMSSKAPVRAAEDVDETALSYSEIKALATGNPLIIEKCNLDMEVSKLNVLKASHMSQHYALEDMVLRKFPAELRELKGRIAGYEADTARAAANPKPAEGFVGITLQGKHYTDKEAAGKAIIQFCTTAATTEPQDIGAYRGFGVSIYYDAGKNQYRLSLKGTLLSHSISLGADAIGNFTRMDNALEALPPRLEKLRAELAELNIQIENAKTELDTPFAKEAELAEKSARLKELNILLNMDQKDRELLDEGSMSEVYRQHEVNSHER